jgi:hypothetical protein
MNDATDDGGRSEGDDRCDGCGHDRCDCNDDRDDDDNCEECAMYGDYQCSRHAEGTIAMMREDHEHFATREALASLLAMPDAWHGVEWEKLRDMAILVLAQMERRGG